MCVCVCKFKTIIVFHWSSWFKQRKTYTNLNYLKIPENEGKIANDEQIKIMCTISVLQFTRLHFYSVFFAEFWKVQIKCKKWWITPLCLHPKAMCCPLYYLLSNALIVPNNVANSLRGKYYSEWLDNFFMLNATFFSLQCVLLIFVLNMLKLLFMKDLSKCPNDQLLMYVVIN
jgi:hypothetical protein